MAAEEVSAAAEEDTTDADEVSAAKKTQMFQPTLPCPNVSGEVLVHQIVLLTLVSMCTTFQPREDRTFG